MSYSKSLCTIEPVHAVYVLKAVRSNVAVFPHGPSPSKGGTTGDATTKQSSPHSVLGHGDCAGVPDPI